MTAISKHTVDPTLTEDVQSLQQNIVAVAKRGKVSKPLQDYSAAKILIEWSKTDLIEIVLFTQYSTNSPVGDFFKWLNINDKVDMAVLFENTQQLQLGDYKVTIYHIDQHLSKKINDAEALLKIIYVDAEFIEHEDWNTAIKLLQAKGAICVFVGNEPVVEIEELCQTTPNNSFINLSGEAVTPFEDIVNQENVTTKFPLIRLCHYVDYLQQVNDLIIDELKTQANLLFGKSILNYQKQLINDRKSELVSSKQGGQFKTLITQKTKINFKEIETELEQVETHDETIMQLKTNLNNFVGFKEAKGSRNVTLKIPTTAIEYFGKSMQAALGNFYEAKLNNTQQLFDHIESKIRADLKTKDIELTKFNAPKQAKDKLAQSGAEFTFEKPYEKQINKKGIGQLLMDLRTPIFMLMPFMMIAGVFGSLMGGKDVGLIDEAKLFYQNRHCIVVNQLPKYYNDEFRVFINNVDKKRTIGCS